MTRPQKQKDRGPALAAIQRSNAAGVHKDQKRRACPKQLRRDKSYRDER